MESLELEETHHKILIILIITVLKSELLIIKTLLHTMILFKTQITCGRKNNLIYSQPQFNIMIICSQIIKLLLNIEEDWLTLQECITILPIDSKEMNLIILPMLFMQIKFIEVKNQQYNWMILIDKKQTMLLDGAVLLTINQKHTMEELLISNGLNN